jgi:hypothetical protein
MAEAGTWAEAEEFRRARDKAATPEQRLAWLQQMLELAQKTGALQRARRKKLENTWKYGKQ